MRLTLIVLAALAVASGGMALPGPLTCSTTCVVASNGAGYVPPLLIVESGASIVWKSLDTSHVSAEGTGLGDAAEPCFLVSYSSSNPSDPVTFAIAAGSVTATVGDDTATCGNTHELPDGGLLLPYWCALHPNMRAALIVEPADGA